MKTNLTPVIPALPLAGAGVRNVFRSILLLCVAVLLVACDDSGGGHRPIGFEDQPGRFAVGRRLDVVLQDAERDREITATYWYPARGENRGDLEAEEGAALVQGDRTFPLVILVHGIFDTAPETWSYLAPHLASHGYIVIAPSTGSNLETADDIANHPGDISFLIDTATGSNDLESLFQGRVDAEKILAGGFSWGGLAAYMFAYEEEHRDDRVSGLLLMANYPSAAPPVRDGLALMILQGTDDPLVPYDAVLNVYEAANAPKYFVALQGAGHDFSASSDDTVGTMEPERLRSLTRIAVLAHLTALFAERSSDREAARQFLQTELEAENSDVFTLAQ